MTVLTGRITSLTIDGNAITNVKYARWNTEHTITPQLLPSDKEATGALQSHTWVTGVIGLQGRDSNLVAPSTADSPIIALIVKTITTAGATYTFTFSGTRIEGVSQDLGGEEPIFEYRFFAYKVVES